MIIRPPAPHPTPSHHEGVGWVRVIGVAVGLVAALGGLVGCGPAVEDWPPVGRVGDPWRAAARVSWQVQLGTRPDLATKADVYVLDAFNAPVSAVDRLHAKGLSAVCRISAGRMSASAPDAARFPAAVVGRTGWLDIRAWSEISPILADRFALCRDKGFDAADPTDVDGYQQPTGFALTAADQLTFNHRVAGLARDAGLRVGLHNDLAQAAALVDAFDFAIDEDCLAARACRLADVFTAAGKPVFHVEYVADGTDLCPQLRGFGYASIVKRSPIEAWRTVC